jgi:hypothetical protein
MDSADRDQLLKVHREGLEGFAAETGLSIEQHEAQALSPSEESAFRTIVKGERVSAERQPWAKQLAVWGLVEPQGYGWKLTEYGEAVAEHLERAEVPAT